MNEQTMIERVAKVMAELLDDSEYNPKVYARAAIAAMREPSEAMCRVGSGRLPREGWQAMIDAVLEEK